jgi:hypothetical protein
LLTELAFMELFCARFTTGTTKAAKRMMMLITTRSSTRVNPAQRPSGRGSGGGVRELLVELMVERTKAKISPGLERLSRRQGRGVPRFFGSARKVICAGLSARS